MYIVFVFSLFLVPFLSKAQTLQVGLSDVGPYAYREHGEIKGVNYDLLTQLSQDSGLNFKYELYPHARLVNAIETSSMDLAIFFSVSCLKNSKHYEIQEKLYEATPTIFVKSSVDTKQKDLRIGRLRGTCSELVKQYVKPEMLTEVNSMEQALEMLKTGRLQGICGLLPVINFYKERIKYQEKLVPLHITQQPLEAVICRKKSLSESIKKKLEAAAKKLKKVRLEE